MNNRLASIGLLCMLGHSICMYIIFLRAYFNNFQTIVHCNLFNEAGFEFVFIPITLVLGVYGFHHSMKALGFEFRFKPKNKIVEVETV